METIKQTRRDMLRKAALFVVPTIVSFQLSELQVQASSRGGNNGNNGNHYGNDRPDQNPTDWKNKFNGGNNEH